MSSPAGNTSDPEGLPLPRHNPLGLQRSKELAKEFYAADSQLNADERKQLARLFYSKTAFWPFLSLPVCYGFIMAPNWLQRAKLIKPRKSWRYWQVALGLAGVFVGLNFASNVATSVQSSKLADKPNALHAYRILAPYPAQIGSNYYQLTARRPDMTMQNPEDIDWSKESLFPLFLIFSRRNLNEARKNADKIRQRSEGSPLPSLEPTNTSWDKVLKGQSHVGSQSSAKSDTTPQPRSQPASASVAQAQFDSLIENAKPNTEEEELMSDQTAFDDLIDREREGTSPQDDFSESEKRWS